MKNKTQAFTLIELLIVIALIGIMAAYGLPGLKSFQVNTALTTNTNDLVTALQLARSAAIRLQDRVVICASETSMKPVPSCGDAATPWHSGWIIFHDKDNNSIYGGLDEILRVQAGVAITGITITPIDAGGTPTNIQNYVSFGPPAGEPMLTDGANQSGVFRVCSASDTEKARGVRLHFSGRISSTLEVDPPCPAL